MHANALNEAEQRALHESAAVLETPIDENDIGQWLSLILACVEQAIGLIRDRRYGSLAGDINYKADDSPVSQTDRDIERLLRTHFAHCAPAARVCGEEFGGDLPVQGVGIAVDPVDGTWAFINAAETATLTLCLYRDGEPVLGCVANPATGEVAYAGPGIAARLLQLHFHAAGARAHPLPYRRDVDGPTLVNLHPSRADAEVQPLLMEAWQQGLIRNLKSTGGSPAWSILDAARGSYTYVNLWRGAASTPYDLGAALLILRAAGGEAVDLNGLPIKAIGHQGTFIAAIDAHDRERVAGIIRST